MPPASEIFLDHAIAVAACRFVLAGFTSLVMFICLSSFCNPIDELHKIGLESVLKLNLRVRQATLWPLVSTPCSFQRPYLTAVGMTSALALTGRASEACTRRSE